LPLSSDIAETLETGLQTPSRLEQWLWSSANPASPLFAKLLG